MIAIFLQENQSWDHTKSQPCALKCLETGALLKIHERQL